MLVQTDIAPIYNTTLLFIFVFQRINHHTLMVAVNSTTTGEIRAATTRESNFDRKSELKAFDDTKTGVKGLVDAGVAELPAIFIHPPENLEDITNNSVSQFEFPVIDLAGADRDPEKRAAVIGRILDASENWGFFQVVNHGIPIGILEEMLNGARRFHEEDAEIRKQYYSRDFTKKMIYFSNFDLYSAAATCWRDSFNYIAVPDPPPPAELPSACRDILPEYSKQVMELGISLFKLLSEALGLNSDRLINIDCAKTLALFGHYYPACPQPELTIGTTPHSDYCFLTLLLQDNLGGLQVLHQNQWVDVPPLPGALVVNIGDLLQVLSNDKLKSAEHRVLVSHSGPRVSVAAFFGRDTRKVNSRLYGPIKELLSENNPPKYRATTVEQYTSYIRNRGLYSKSGLQSLRI